MVPLYFYRAIVSASAFFRLLFLARLGLVWKYIDHKMQGVLIAFAFMSLIWFSFMVLRYYDVGFGVVGEYAPQLVSTYYLIESVVFYYILDISANKTK